MRNESLSQRLVRGLIEIDDIPRDVVDTVETRIIDTLGAALSAAAVGEGTAASQALAEVPGRATFWASGGRRGDAAFAALANGALCHAMDYDDTHTGSVIHPSGVVLPAAFAVGEEVGASGQSLLTAAVVGYEAAIRLGMAAPGAFQPRGFQGTAILGPFAAALVAGKLTGASAEVIANAWGIAGSMASGINEFHADGTGAKQLHLGWAAHSGILALRLAEAGATGPATVLEGREGVYSLFGGVSKLDPTVERDVGTVYHLRDVATKPYPACHCIHPVVDAWLDLNRQIGGIKPEQISRIICLVPEWYLGIILEPRAVKASPRTSYAARFSLPYSMAKVILDGYLGPESFDLDSLSNPRLQRLIDLVDYETMEFPEFPAYFPGGVRVELDDGRSLESIVRHNRGSDCFPMTEDEISEKLRHASDQIGSDNSYEELTAAVKGLPSASNLDALSGALTKFNAFQARTSSA